MIILLLVIAVSGWIGFGFLLIRRRSYDGEVVITNENGKQIFTLELNMDPYDIIEKDSIVLKVLQPE